MCVWEVRRRYTPDAIHLLVAQEAHDYFSVRGFPPGYQRRQIGVFMDKEYHSWELVNDEEDEDDESYEDESYEDGEGMVRNTITTRKRRGILETTQNPSSESSSPAPSSPSSPAAFQPEDVDCLDEDPEGEVEVDLEALSDPSFPSVTIFSNESRSC